jgi:hypothetical protein
MLAVNKRTNRTRPNNTTTSWPVVNRIGQRGVDITRHRPADSLTSTQHFWEFFKGCFLNPLLFTVSAGIIFLAAVNPYTLAIVILTGHCFRAIPRELYIVLVLGVFAVWGWISVCNACLDVFRAGLAVLRTRDGKDLPALVCRLCGSVYVGPTCSKCGGRGATNAEGVIMGVGGVAPYTISYTTPNAMNESMVPLVH